MAQFKLILKDQLEQLLENGAAAAKAIAIDGNTADVYPVVKFFTPDGSCTWLISEMDPDEPDRLFGLCDLGMGYPELGNVLLSEIQSGRGLTGLPIERDSGFTAKQPLVAYAKDARDAGYIVT